MSAEGPSAGEEMLLDEEEERILLEVWSTPLGELTEIDLDPDKDPLGLGSDAFPHRRPRPGRPVRPRRGSASR